MEDTIHYIRTWFLDNYYKQNDKFLSFEFFRDSEIIHETAKAYLVKKKRWKNKTVWIPKSQTVLNPNAVYLPCDNYYSYQDEYDDYDGFYFDDDLFGGPH